MRTPETTGDGPGAGSTRTVVILPWEHERGRRSAEARLAEAVGLVRAIDLDVVHETVLPVRRRRPSTYLGAGQVEDVGGLVGPAHAELVVIDAAISPVQQRNLERAWNCKVIDRSGLILDIFGERAVTREGVLQVELAHLEYQRSRLVRSWTHLERQRGGFGFLGGPGETQIEADRRLIAERITKIKRELEQVRRTRGLHRGARRRVPLPVVALVGYTNAGKSTLFNALTGAAVTAQDQLFATLDPTTRQMVLPSGQKAVLTDTVGFISELPTELVASFRATLEEVGEADLIVHVRDAAHPDSAAQRADVASVMDGMVEEGSLDPDWPSRTIEVLNKIDLIDEKVSEPAGPAIVPVSATRGLGLEELRRVIDARLSCDREELLVTVPASDGARLAWLHEHGDVLSRETRDSEVCVRVRLSSPDRARLEHWLRDGAETG